MKILYFAWLREKVGVPEENLAVPADVLTVQDLIVWLRSQSPRHKAAFENDKLVRCAINQEFVTLAARIEAAVEIAFFPPVTGG
jgi:molybdopterin synthase sulfur carrier subunit